MLSPMMKAMFASVVMPMMQDMDAATLVDIREFVNEVTDAELLRRAELETNGRKALPE